MSASLLPPDSAAAHRSGDLLADSPQLRDMPGLPQARMLVEYIIGRRLRELDVSGRDAAGAFIDVEAAAEAPRRIIVLDDAKGVQTALLRSLAEVVVHHDRIDESRTAASLSDVPELADLGEPESAHFADGRAPSAGEGNPETWAVINAPKATNALAESIAALQARVSTIIVIGRSDSMSRAVNKELARGFARVDVSPGVGKHRMIIGSRPLSSPSLPSFPKHGVITHPNVGDLEVRAHGACFSGVKSDEGSTLLLDALIETLSGADDVTGTAAEPDSVLDLGCGNGWLLTAAMRATGAARGTGVDVSEAAVASARATAEANGVDVDIILGDAADTEDPAVAALGEFALVVLNPPFHQGTTIETDTAEALMATAAAHLAPGGRVITVFNTHLRYRDRLETIIGPSEQLGRNTKFTVVSSGGGICGTSAD
ncbi:class I SAM-dependent methyltransferase [Brevibacterium limosum]|uniref:class I SAM-dependent methyltransferase n=1 Tax=Brevibacterium limosum TaxID=2697565 RepID=UPI00141E8348|nr:methyltransferase [Brevibacterium limosum]